MQLIKLQDKFSMHEGLYNRAPPKLKNRGAGREEENKHTPAKFGATCSGPHALVLIYPRYSTFALTGSYNIVVYTRMA